MQVTFGHELSSNCAEIACPHEIAEPSARIFPIRLGLQTCRVVMSCHGTFEELPDAQVEKRLSRRL